MLWLILKKIKMTTDTLLGIEGDIRPNFFVKSRQRRHLMNTECSISLSNPEAIIDLSPRSDRKTFEEAIALVGA